MVRRRTNSPRFSLAPNQRTHIITTANQLRPNQRYSFVLRVERALAISTTSGFASDALVSRAIDKALHEVTNGPSV